MSATSVLNGQHLTFNEAAEQWEPTNALPYIEAIMRLLDPNDPAIVGLISQLQNK